LEPEKFQTPAVHTKGKMAQIVKDSFLDIERHRQLLEKNIEKLRKSLRHWQTWEAEYEGLKEEILGRVPPPNREQLIELARNYEGELVNQKEINDILGKTPRTPAQVVNLLDRRIDYVEQNVGTFQKQIEVAENKLAAATIISKPDVRNEEGLPLTDIVEELDEEGNIISSRISTPGSAKPQLLEVLQKAGVQNLPESDNLSQDVQRPPEDKLEDPPAETKPAKKGVKFSADTKIGPEPEKPKTAKRVETIMNLAKQQDTRPSEPPIIPTDESPEDAALRREMLQYGMSEVGAVVAELDLEEGSDSSGGEYDDYEEGESSTDDEDEFGRSTGNIVDDELRQQMMELEERLGVRMMENAGPKQPDDYDIVKEGIGRISINGEDENAVKKAAVKESAPGDSTDLLSIQASKKSVRFSEEIDVSPAPKPPSNLPGKTTAPVSDIVERTAPAQVVSPKAKKTSRFKLDRAGGGAASHTNKSPLPAGNPVLALSLQPAKPSTPKPFSTPIQYEPQERTRVTPTGPQGKTLASAIIERDVPLNASAAAPDELDPDLLHQEVATEYHKMRNKMIQRQGGFMKEDESEIVTRTEEEGGPKKMSRFKAARLAKS
jgi:unconventional prefoldin RPB5 interactor 1